MRSFLRWQLVNQHQLPWDAAQKTAFLQMQFAAQHAYYQEHYAAAYFNVILVHSQPAGRLNVNGGRRAQDCRHRAAAAVVEPRHRPCARHGAAGRGRRGGQAAAHPRRARQPRPAPLPAARLQTDRRSRRLPVHGMDRSPTLQSAVRSPSHQSQSAVPPSQSQLPVCRQSLVD
jgi:hypothetical protein